MSIERQTQKITLSSNTPDILSNYIEHLSKAFGSNSPNSHSIRKYFENEEIRVILFHLSFITLYFLSLLSISLIMNPNMDFKLILQKYISLCFLLFYKAAMV